MNFLTKNRLTDIFVSGSRRVFLQYYSIKQQHYYSEGVMGDTFLLLARPSFIEGLARNFDLGSTLNEYNYSNDENEADSKALYADWHSIGNDLMDSIEQLEFQFPEEREPKFDFK